VKYEFGTKQVETHFIRAMLVGVETTLPPEANATLQMPITKEELRVAVERGKKLKTPGYDGMCTDFFQLAWPLIGDELLTIVNIMFIDGVITPSQTHGVIIYVPKKKKTKGQPHRVTTDHLH
jgi:hypothetical protein